MRKHGKVDANQPSVVDALRKAGAVVWITSDLGCGAPDLVVGFRGMVYLVEIKDGAKVPSKQALTDDEITFHADWKARGATVWIIRSETEAIRMLGDKR